MLFVAKLVLVTSMLLCTNVFHCQRPPMGIGMTTPNVDCMVIFCSEVKKYFLNSYGLYELLFSAVQGN